MSSSSLRKLLAGWNEVSRLAERMERSQLEVLDLQHNHLTDLPHNMFSKAQRCLLMLFSQTACVVFLETFIQLLLCLHHSLRYLNVSANRLESLPAASLSEDSSGLEELYLTRNRLADQCVPLLSQHGRLKVLHLAYNQLHTFTAR